MDVVKAGERRVTTLVSGEDSGGRIAIVELHEVAGQEPPRHLHGDEDETVYVQDGELSVLVGDEVRRVAAGECVFLPRGVEHGYLVETDDARLIVVLTPAGLEGALGEFDVGEGEAGVERLITVAARYGVTITGPAPVKSGHETLPGSGTD